MLVGVLKGAMVFLADLLRAIARPVECDFIAVSSYGAASRSSGIVQLIADLSVSIEGRDVVMVEDIVDTGRTLTYLLRNLGTRQPRSLRVCALLDKATRLRRRFLARARAQPEPRHHDPGSQQGDADQPDPRRA